jgi:hypothetical protein
VDVQRDHTIDAYSLYQRRDVSRRHRAPAKNNKRHSLSFAEALASPHVLCTT